MRVACFIRYAKRRRDAPTAEGPCLRRITRPPAPKPSMARRFQQALAGLIALACVVGLFFALLHWRVNTPGLHLNFGNATYDRLSGQKNE